VAVRDGFELRAGRLRIAALETPGHTPEGICLVVTDEEKAPAPWAVLTGDTLFIGDVGRPDLSKDFTPPELAGMLYDSLHNKLLRLPDATMVYPAHGAGSLCGRNMRAERSSTIGTERLTNYALQIRTREEFVRQLTANLPARPEYFLQDAQINRQGAPPLADLPEMLPISPAGLKALLEEGAIGLDVRPNAEFAAGHVPGSINIALSGQFASWAGALLGLSASPVLIADTAEQYAEARMRLARVGLESPRGFLAGGIAAWKEAGLELAAIPQMTVQELHQQNAGRTLQVLDVRRAPEWEAGHISGAAWWPLDNFKTSPPELRASSPVAVHCQGGYRSMTACSLLRRAGMHDVINIVGGFDAWQKAGLPVITRSHENL
jgi:rhodanese-related sulfurtransferase